MCNINYLRTFILIILTNTLLVIGISSPEASDGEEEMDGFRTVAAPRRRLRSNHDEPITTYLPEIIVSSPDKNIRECQDRAKFFAASQNLKTYDAAQSFMDDPSSVHYTSDLINLANHYRHIPNEETISLASRVFNNIVSSKSKFITSRHKSLSYLGLAKIQGRAKDYENAISLASHASIHESTEGIKTFLAIMEEKLSKSTDVKLVVAFTPHKRKRAAF